MFESNTMVYIAMCLGDIIGIAADKLKTDIKLADYCIIIPCLIIQVVSMTAFFILYRHELCCRKNK